MSTRENCAVNVPAGKPFTVTLFFLSIFIHWATFRCHFYKRRENHLNVFIFYERSWENHFRNVRYSKYIVHVKRTMQLVARAMS